MYSDYTTRHRTTATPPIEPSTSQIRSSHPTGITSAKPASPLILTTGSDSDSLDKPLEVRAFVAPRRTGSTLFASKVACLPEVSVCNRVVSRSDKHGRNDFTPNHTIFYDQNHRNIASQARAQGSTMLAIKEEFGDDSKRGTATSNECAFDVFPDQEAFERSRPVIGFREPVATFASWKHKSWDDMDSFVVSYNSAKSMLSKSEDTFHEPPVYIYESFTGSSESAKKFMQKASDHWETKYDDSYDEPKPLGTGFVYLNEGEKSIYEQNSAGLFNKDLQVGKVVKQEKRDTLTDSEAARVASMLGQGYTEIVQKHALEEDKYSILRDSDYRTKKV